jgi:hypothetical protein
VETTHHICEKWCTYDEEITQKPQKLKSGNDV